MESVENKIIRKMKKCGRGSVFFINDFLAYGTRSAVSKSLERMVLQGSIIRAARGIYCYPKLEKVYGLGIIAPSCEDIAVAVAKRDGAQIVPSGAFAQYQLGLTQQMPLNYHYLTRSGTIRSRRPSGSFCAGRTGSTFWRITAAWGATPPIWTVPVSGYTLW